jgi:GNAT superfamily N-acetyltransferase
MPFPPFHWRPATAADVEPLAVLYADAAARLGPRVYTPEQAAAWAAFPRQDMAAFRRYVLGHDTWVAERAEDFAVLGFCGVGGAGEQREVHSLYVRPAASRQGIGGEMLRRTLARAEAAGARGFAAWATPFSRPVFLRAGFEWTRTVVEPFAGVMFERYRVERG